MREALDRAGLPLAAVKAVGEHRHQEGRAGPCVLLRRHTDCRFAVYSAEELNAAPGEFTASEFVKSTVGVDSVCERAAVVNAGNGTIIARKYAKNGVTRRVCGQADTASAWKNDRGGTNVKLCMAGIDHVSAALEQRERLSLVRGQVQAVLPRIAERTGCAAVLLATMQPH
ncbi:MAG: cobalamin biosynthesis protein [Butyricicoccaceae bacterium]